MLEGWALVTEIRCSWWYRPNHDRRSEAVPGSAPLPLHHVQLFGTATVPRYSRTARSFSGDSRIRRRYRMLVYGYVVMPEHVHLLVGEPEGGLLAKAIQLLKQNVSRIVHASEPVGAHPSNPGQGGAPAFWLPRYFDLNVWSQRKLIDKLRYIHRNPVKRGLVRNPEDWKWSSFRHYMFGEVGPVEIESRWTARKRWISGLRDPTIKKIK